MSNALVIAPQWIGDAVMTEPLLRRLVEQGARITVGALPWVAPVYRAMPQVHAVIEFPFAHGGLQWAARRRMAKTLRGQFDVAYVCPNSLKSALLPFWAGIPQRVGYQGEMRYGLLTQRLPQPKGSERLPMVAHYAALAGAPTQADGIANAQPRLTVSAEALATQLQRLQRAPQSYYVFAPGAEYGPAKRWPVAHFAAVAQALALPVLLLGSAKDADICAQIVEFANAKRPGACVDLSAKTSLDQAIATIAGAKAVLSNDSGLMHVAAALQVPQVALFGSSSPLHTPPLSDLARVLWLKNDPEYRPALDCAPCFERICPLGHTRCLVDLLPTLVLSNL